MEQEIINYLKSFLFADWCYVKITDANTLKIIYNLLINQINNTEEETIINNPILCYYYAIYYRSNNNNQQTKKFFKIAVNQGINEAMDALAYYYYREGKYEKMKRNCIMAIERGNKRSICRLGRYYQETLKDYDQMKKHYLEAIELGEIIAMRSLGNYYQNIGDYQQMESYYLMAISRGDDLSLTNLSNYYSQVNKIDELINCNAMSIIKYNNKYAFKKLIDYYNGDLDDLLNRINLYKELNKLKQQFSSLIIKELPINVLHFRFRDQSLGMKIMHYHFKLNSGESDEFIYQQLKEQDSQLLDYLTIIDVSQVKEKINNYINI